ncbi:pyridoxal phosphate biosynthesis protein [Peptococcaceae bacterium SCADC1_2_3]|jgi:pyridoxal phosphate enzyme (YggS family)|nr:pyridoxal phosphate biosynthesis protein [Peptococcaceae bacterium SCADC1_2_3]KFI35340.1 pyridoxal phosphate biosynthesis protein [Peptococcaceae bacterium SCADC1_2_3]KFI35868.1 pyridoxal phosphate biosynthesis protein [Peptococcaceae bacterium SCADC1_2_3]KFI37996.1 pyridoxal phosphate biosynthesis protein [Peptococcaceae bacterium SCADC1_2_3]HCJ79434.1 YggS family pyridoxal phosphate-dependent enzyme [Desulfotomaculum sp.]
MGIRENLLTVYKKIKLAAKKSGRNPEVIKIVAVTKTISPQTIQEAINEGLTTFGENKVQELLAKQPLLPPGIEWHMIGHLQTNKVKNIVGKVKLIHSLDRYSLAQEINRWALKKSTKVNVLVQVNVSGEPSKHGLAPVELTGFLDEVAHLPGLQILGLMAMAPQTDNPEETRPVFRKLRVLAENSSKNRPGLALVYLSMGMSNDYEVAVEEGANIVRIGSAIFSA